MTPRNRRVFFGSNCPDRLQTQRATAVWVALMVVVWAAVMVV